MRSIEWDETNNIVRMIDQRYLPRRIEWVLCSTYQEVAKAIQDMVIRGAPAIGVAGAMGMALAAINCPDDDPNQFRAFLNTAHQTLRSSRPTAVNLFWALDRIQSVIQRPIDNVEKLKKLILAEAMRIAEEDVVINHQISTHGAELIQDGDVILHHCNTGALATVDWGTALGCIRKAHLQGKRIHVLVDETRPRLQGARLTAWELEQYGIPYEIIVDGAAGYFLRSGKVKKVFFGADRIAANGDVANKIGTYMLALSAHENGVPVYCAAPTSTIDMSIPNGDVIPIEERSADEVLDIQYKGEAVAPIGAKARNPAFDITPHSLITALITEKGVIYPPFQERLLQFLSH